MLTLTDLMSKPVVVVTPQTRTADVLATAEALHIHHFPIVRAGKLVGFVCTCDLSGAAPDDPVMPLAWHHPATVSPSCQAKDAAQLLLLYGVGSLLIVDPRGIRGIVTANDLRRASPELETLLEAAHCVDCGAGEHLRPGPQGKPICVSCQARH